MTANADKSGPLAAIRAANALVARSGRLTATTGAPIAAAQAGSLLPTAAARAAIDALVDAGTVDRVREDHANFKRLLQGALDWHGPKFTHSTKAVARAVGAVAQGSVAGVSSYPQAVELVSFLAVASPLLEPDRLARIAEHASSTPFAYGPTLYQLGPAGQLRQLLSCYTESRREQLLKSLWDAIHDGRWFDHTIGRQGHQTRHRSRVSAEERAAINRQLESLMRERGIPELDLLTKAMVARTLSYSADMVALVKRIPEPTTGGRRTFLDVLHRSDDEDHRLLAARIPWLLPGERPESPAATMIALLLTVRGGPADFDPDQMPKDPDSWEDLYPAASQAPFPYPELFKKIQGTRMPGLPGNDIRFMLNADRLKQNGDHMGNCTFSYRQQCEQGTCVIGHCTYEGVEFNYELGYTADRGWVRRQVNSRFNGGNVPNAVTDAVDRLAHGINAALAGRARDAID